MTFASGNQSQTESELQNLDAIGDELSVRRLTQGAFNRCKVLVQCVARGFSERIVERQCERIRREGFRQHGQPLQGRVIDP